MLISLAKQHFHKAETKARDMHRKVAMWAIAALGKYKNANMDTASKRGEAAAGGISLRRQDSADDSGSDSD